MEPTKADCPTCGATGNARCQTILYVRQDDGTYAQIGRPTSDHTARKVVVL